MPPVPTRLSIMHAIAVAPPLTPFLLFGPCIMNEPTLFAFLMPPFLSLMLKITCKLFYAHVANK